MEKTISSLMVAVAIALLAGMLLTGPALADGPTSVTLPGSSLTTATGAYQSAVQAYAYKWDVRKGDLTIEGTIDLGGIQARGNTWDSNLADGDDWFGLWAQVGLVKAPVFNSSDGVWMVTVEWTGGGDDLDTQIREILHMQEEPGTQPMPKLYTDPRTIAGGDGDDTHTFKLQIHSTGATTGWAKLWIDGQQVKGDMWSVFTPEEMAYSGEDLSSAQVLVGIMSGNNPNNPAHTFSWSDLTVTGHPASYSEVWVDDDWTGTSAGTEVEPGKYFGFNAFATIQAGVDAVVAGGTVHVAAGTYAEYVHITKDGLTVQGAGMDQSIIDLDGLTPYWHYTGSSSYASRGGVLISGYGNTDGEAELVENVTFSGFTVKNAGVNAPSDPGLNPTWYDEDGDGRDDVRGILIHSGKNITIQNCKVQNSGDYGISSGRARQGDRKNSEALTISGCTVSNNHDTGINIAHTVGTNGATITDNTVSDNLNPANMENHAKGICVSGRSDSALLGGTISGNTVSGNVYYGIEAYKYTDGVTIENNDVTGHNLHVDAAGIFVSTGWGFSKTCKNHTVQNNTVTDNIRGIIVYYAWGDNPGDLLISGNTISTNAGAFAHEQAAIKIDHGYNLSVQNNTVSCDGPGIRVLGGDSHDNSFIGNTITGAEIAGIMVDSGAHDNTFTNNTISGTTIGTKYAGQAYEINEGDGVLVWGDEVNAPGSSAGTGNVFHGNAIYGNADDGMENQTATTVDASGNWWGDNDPAGVATEVSANVDYTPWLDSGSDTSGDPGFQGDFSELWVDDDSPQTGATGHIQEGINMVSGSTVYVAAGTYNERVTIDKPLDLRGAQYGVDPTAAGARTDPSGESIITEAGLSTPNPDILIEIANGVSNVTVDGFTLIGDPTNTTADTSVVRCWDDSINISNNIIDGMYGVLYKGGAGLTVHQNRMVVNKLGVTVQPNPASNVTISDNVFNLGSSPAGGESATYMTSCSHCSVTGNTATGFVNGRGTGGSNLSHLTVSGNTFTGNKDAVSIWGNSTDITISDNDLSSSLRYGINIKGQDVDITRNQITNNGDAGVNVDRHVIDTERVTIVNNNISGNTNYGVYVNTGTVTEIINAASNWWGAADGPSGAGSGSGDAVSANVVFCPWLDAPFPGGNPASGDGLVTNLNTGEIFCTIQAAIDDPDTISGAGHVIEATTGVYEENVVVYKDGLTIRSAPGDSPVLDGSSKPADYYGNKGFWIQGDRHDITIDGFEIKDYPEGPEDGAGIFAGSTASGPDFPGTVQNITLRNNVIHDNGNDGIQIEQAHDGQHTGIVIENNDIYNHQNDANMSAGIKMYDARGALITGNTLHTNERGILFYRNVAETTVEHNHIYNTTGASNGEGIKLDDHSNYNVVRYNYVYDSPHDDGIRLDDDSNNNEIYHNTIYNNAGHGILLEDNSINNFVRDNIIDLSGGYGINDENPASNTEHYNLFHANASGSHSNGGIDPTDIEADPIFLEPVRPTFTPRCDSPAESTASDTDGGNPLDRGATQFDGCDTSIKVIKDAGGGTSTEFTFTFTDQPDFELKHGEEKLFENLLDGNYTITEIVPKNWALLSIVCTVGGEPVITLPSPDPAEVTIELDSGEHFECTFYNEWPTVEEGGHQYYLPLIVK